MLLSESLAVKIFGYLGMRTHLMLIIYGYVKFYLNIIYSNIPETSKHDMEDVSHEPFLLFSILQSAFAQLH